MSLSSVTIDKMYVYKSRQKFDQLLYSIRLLISICNFFIIC